MVIFVTLRKMAWLSVVEKEESHFKGGLLFILKMEKYGKRYGEDYR